MIEQPTCPNCKARPCIEGYKRCQKCRDAFVELRELYKQEGKCSCGRKPENGFKTCLHCRDRKNKARNSRIANGHCANCGEKHDEDKRVCAKCRPAYNSSKAEYMRRKRSMERPVIVIPKSKPKPKTKLKPKLWADWVSRMRAERAAIHDIEKEESEQAPLTPDEQA